MLLMRIPCVLILLGSVQWARCWDSDDLEVFDAVEDVGENFYELLGLPEDASASDIKKAFRRLSLVLHPDKNDAADAEIQFRRLVSVYDVLKDPKKRAKYHDVLEHGLPDWKQAVYYYRRVRKMGLLEMSIILFVIITIGQYLVAWAAYFEKRYAIQEFLDTKRKALEKKQKKGKIDPGISLTPEILEGLPKPTVGCTLPFQIARLVWFLIVEAPPLTVRAIKQYWELRRQQKLQQEEESSSEEEEPVIVRERGPRRRRGFQVPEVSSTTPNLPPSNGKLVTTKAIIEEPPVISGGLWTDDDFADLIRLMKKFPPGTQDRWEKIGRAMRRPPNEVAHMAHKLKDDGFKPLASKQTEEEAVPEEPKKVKSRGKKAGPEDGVDESNWSQVQQKALEAALAKYPKGSSNDRWDRIAKAVPGKTKEECMLRFKYLADLVRKRKEQSQDSQDENECPPIFEQPS